MTILYSILFAIGFCAGWHQMPQDFFAAVCCGLACVGAVFLIREFFSRK